MFVFILGLLLWVMSRAQLKTNAGHDFQALVMGGASNGTGTSASAQYMGLTTDTGQALNASQTTLTGELSGSGLQRQLATYAHTAGTNTYTLTKVFTSSDGTPRTISRMAIFNASSAGTMVFFSALPSPPVVQNTDQLTVTETITM